MIPKVHYADTSSGQVAYMVFGQGPLEILCCEGAGAHLELGWDLPVGSRFYQGLATFARVALFDQRGFGMSDPVPSGRTPTWEDVTEDFGAVIAAANLNRPVLYVSRDAAIPGLLFASTQPERVSALIECNGTASYFADSSYAAGHTPEQVKQFGNDFLAGWGTEPYIAKLYPSLAGNEAVTRSIARMNRASASPRRALESLVYATRLDARPFLGAIRVPTMIIHTEKNPLAPLDAARYLASHIAGAKLLVLPGGDCVPYTTDYEVLVGHFREFLTGSRRFNEVDTVLATVMFLDLVDSTELAAKIGDGAYRETLSRFYLLAREELGTFRGRELDTSGDGLLASFEGPGRAIRCAKQIRERLKPLGLSLRAGVHTGECEKLDDKLAGMTVNIGARVCAKASAGEVMTSSTVKDLLIGSGIEFADRGRHDLKGVPGHWQLFAAC